LIKTRKRNIRELVNGLRETLSERDRDAWSDAIEDRLFGFEPFAAARTVLFYASFNNEVRTGGAIRRAIREGKRIAVPVTKVEEKRLETSLVTDFDEDLQPGAFGIPEPKPGRVRPVPDDEIDIVVVPGVAFDRRGNRVGYGGGYYDRFVGRVRIGVPLIAVAFAFQLMDEVPAAEHDLRVDALITEEETIVFE